MSLFWSCLVGPRLYSVYGQIRSGKQVIPYVANALEQFGNNIMKGLNIMYNIGYFASPFIAYSVYQWEYSSYITAAKYGTGLGLLLIVAMIIRGFGRRFNPTYTTFIKVLNKAGNYRPSLEDMEAVQNYEFDFSAWPVNFDWASGVPDEKKNRIYVVGMSLVRSKRGILSRILMLPIDIMATLLTFLIGKQLIYPGCSEWFQTIIGQILMKEREKLILHQGGQRRKVTTRDGNSIDTMFVDRRKHGEYPNGKTLVVCCEGNAGFYELGIMTVPLDAGYSVLGWNHPGFGGSTGSPYPSQEQNAADVVMHYALHELGFKPEDIIVYGWSIGGYTSTWMAMNYPQLGGLVLDATFDDVLPLAIMRMPSCMEGIVTSAIRNHFNLTPGAQLSRYPGPVTIIRRIRDEIITTDETQLSGNLGNSLLEKLLKSRYPALMCKQSVEVLHQWLNEDPSFKSSILNRWGVDGVLCSTLLATYVNEYSTAFPLMIGEDMNEEEKTRLLLYLASKHMVDYNESHNPPLDVTLFRKPWRIISDSSYVQVD
ncbi:phosphatidylserine lipase ABHD16A isoform X2 [Penaeus vannamei]|uniref:phosphatidylserine lipase ABHD16A isoform X2 n=1 Tax=Penaeus vannamei TaxID=6689 RepID=UPI000F68D68C|nr:protein ABHD16A-like [Penaeus vannamei]